MKHTWEPDHDRSLRVDQVAAILNTSERSVYRIIADGTLEAFRVRGSLRIRQSALQSYIERQISIFRLEIGFIDQVDNG